MKSYLRMMEQVLLIESNQKEIIKGKEIMNVKTMKMKKIILTIVKDQQYSRKYQIPYVKMMKIKVEIIKQILESSTDNNMKQRGIQKLIKLM